MIHRTNAKSFCKDDISKIENYELAISDKNENWVCHHRLELTLDGEFAHTREELIRMDMYYNRPYFELIWLPKSEHSKLHYMVNTKAYPTWAEYNSSDKRKKELSVIRSKSNNGRHWYTNGIENKFTYECPEGFYPGQHQNKRGK